MKRSFDVQLGMGTEKHPARVEQEKIRPTYIGTKQSVNEGLLPSCHPAYDVLYGGGTRKCGAFTRENIEPAETVKLIFSGDRTLADGIIASADLNGCAQCTVRRDGRLCPALGHRKTKQEDRGKKERSSGLPKETGVIVLVSHFPLPDVEKGPMERRKSYSSSISLWEYVVPKEARMKFQEITDAIEEQ
jgi:hypothetical protein